MDVYFKKEISYSFAGDTFAFDIANDLFSTFDLDHGTDILIRAITPNNPKSILDIGCGYGPLGIILARCNPNAKVTMIDRDLLAIRYATLNIAKCNVANATAIASLGVEQVKDKTFDLIVSNIPAKIGDAAITQEFILEPYKLLSSGGEYWIVVVSALNRLIPKACSANNIKLEKIRKRKGHTVYKILKTRAG